MNQFEELLDQCYNELNESEGSIGTSNVGRANVGKSPRVERRKRARALSKVMHLTKRKQNERKTITKRMQNGGNG